MKKINTVKLKYKFINWMANRLGCPYIIDSEEYEAVIPYVPKPFKGKLPNGLFEPDPLINNIFLAKMPTITPFADRLKEMGLGKPKEGYVHYESPRNNNPK